MLVDFDTPDLAQELEAIASKDEAVLLELAEALHGMSWQEKMAVATYATVAINPTPTQLCIIVWQHGNYGPALISAIEMLKRLSPQALCELAVDLISDDWDLGPIVSDAPSTLIK